MKAFQTACMGPFPAKAPQDRRFSISFLKTQRNKTKETDAAASQKTSIQQAKLHPSQMKSRVKPNAPAKPGLNPPDSRLNSSQSASNSRDFSYLTTGEYWKDMAETTKQVFHTILEYGSHPKKIIDWLKNAEHMTLFSLGLFYLASFIAVTMVSRSFLNKVFVLLRFASYGLLGLLALYGITGRGSLKSMAMNLIRFFADNWILDAAVVISLLSSYYRKAIEPMILLLLMITARQIGIKRVIKLFFWVGGISMAVTVFLALIHFLPNPAFIRAGVKRYGLGFIYPLETHSSFYLIGLSGLYSYWKKNRWIPEILFLLVSAFLFSYTKARFSMILTVLTTVLFLIGANVPQDKMRAVTSSKLVRILLVVFAVGMFIMPGVLAYNFRWGSSFFEALDHLVNKRLVLGRQAFAYEPVYPFGAPIVWVGYGGANGISGMRALEESYNYVDCSYLKNMFDYGYVYMVLEFGFYAWILLHYARKQNWAMVFCAMSIMFLGLFEARLIQVAVNPFVLAGGGLLFWRPWKKNEKNENPAAVRQKA